MFEITNSTGFRITYANGYTISVQFGHFNYCSNRNDDTKRNGSRDAEVAVLNHRNEFVRDYPHNDGSDDVVGWCTPKQVLDIMVHVAAL